ncbi:MAG: ArsC family reductase [Alphaproteobacteria bacterium]
MTDTIIYGIKNCDTMKKAFKWLDSNNVEFKFHDYKKQDIDKDILQQAIKDHGWENVINRRGTTWRKLSDEVKESTDNASAIDLALDNPSIVKRPLLSHKGCIFLGFKDDEYSSIFNS